MPLASSDLGEFLKVVKFGFYDHTFRVFRKRHVSSNTQTQQIFTNFAEVGITMNFAVGSGFESRDAAGLAPNFAECIQRTVTVP